MTKQQRCLLSFSCWMLPQPSTFPKNSQHIKVKAHQDLGQIPNLHSHHLQDHHHHHYHRCHHHPHLIQDQQSHSAWTEYSDVLWASDEELADIRSKEERLILCTRVPHCCGTIWDWVGKDSNFFLNNYALAWVRVQVCADTIVKLAWLRGPKSLWETFRAVMVISSGNVNPLLQ